VRGEGEAPSGRNVAGGGDVNGDGIADLIVGGVPTYVVYGKPDSRAVELSEVHAGRDGLAIRGSAEGDLWCATATRGCAV
jgi:hypothetical protein